jgi:CheY-like chemotaxis protein
MKKDEIECRQTGMDDHLSKPLDREALARCLELHLGANLGAGRENPGKLSGAA